MKITIESTDYLPEVQARSRDNWILECDEPAHSTCHETIEETLMVAQVLMRRQEAQA